MTRLGSLLAWGRQYGRRRFLERRVLRLASRGEGEALLQLIGQSNDESAGLMARGAYARWLFTEGRLRDASSEFSRLRTVAKEAGGGAGDYVNLFCLCYLALVRGTRGYDEAARFARQARRAHCPRRMRTALFIPLLPERAFLGTVVTYSLKPDQLPSSRPV